eukprot:SAG11_NODE_19137_length_473_cov_1.374332_1_plen_35_part_01
MHEKLYTSRHEAFWHAVKLADQGKSSSSRRGSSMA